MVISDSVQTLRWLIESYPHTFFEDPRRVQPLAVCVIDQLVQRHAASLSKEKLLAAITMYQRSRCYRQAVANGRPSIDLAGYPSAPPTTEEQRVAGQWLERWSVLACFQLVGSSNLTPDVRRELITILEQDYQESKIVSSVYARSMYSQETFDHRREMVRIVEALYWLDKQPRREGDVQYALYWEAISGFVISELAGNFRQAREYVVQAVEAARYFVSSRGFYPNLVFDEQELASRGQYIDALESFRSGHFGDAAESLHQWLTKNEHLRERGWKPYETNEVIYYICAALQTVAQRLDGSRTWAKAEELLQLPNSSIDRTARSLWNYLQPLRALSQREYGDLKNDDVLNRLLEEVKQKSHLLHISASLSDKDRKTSLETSVRLPAFIDVFHLVNDVGELWRVLLLETLRHAVMLKAEFETFLQQRAFPGTKAIGVSTRGTFEIEQLNDVDLINYTRLLVELRERSDARIYDSLISLWWEACRAVREDSQADAVKKCYTFYKRFRKIPHTIRIISCKPTELASNESKSTRLPYKVLSRRIWRYSPTQLELKTSDALQPNTYAYLRPGWNLRLGFSYRLEPGRAPVFTTRMPEWMSLFEQWASGLGPHVVSGSSFLRWYEQIEPRWRSVALRLLTKFVFLSGVDIRSMWKALYEEQLSVHVKKERVQFIGLGNPSKSGTHQLYWLRQALSDIGGGMREVSYGTVDSLSRVEKNTDCFVFVDDLFGTGRQAKDFYQPLLNDQSWLKTRHILLCAVVGFKTTMCDLENALNLSGKVLAAKTLNEEDRAFSKDNPLWDSARDREQARSWCEELGTILEGPDEALGWGASEALIAFEYNTPDNTLPLFRSRGINGREWFPLFDRF